MKQDYHQLLKPDVINSVSGLALIARVIVDGYLAGMNSSRRIGYGMEFNQYKHYEPGDDLRLLDWKMLARSGKHYIKKSEIETNVSVKFVIDSSKSMQHEEGAIRKIDFVKVMVAALAYLSNSQGDEIGLFSMNNLNIESLYPGGSKQHFNYFLHKLIAIEAEGTQADHRLALQHLHTRKQKELIIFISDMYETNRELSTVLKGLKTPKNEVIVFHVMGKNELDFNYKGSLTFEDLETGESIKIDAGEARSSYMEALASMEESLRAELLANDITYQLINLNTPAGTVLQSFLKKRNNMS
ncbi:DUF58 domain-containing protein [Robertkochia solimangrovi]|uniref:DUF58 domain-containing protein n=1 Tax=Robertkochia solimangrovi TaxID=2213046 RepID=UPI001180670D|nr:DUF58 domain-containing protein [Robertkochia solimangrovi]TRZ43170.1 DUF58 domain-containing protein [Robertkochia solimangrovi]